MNSNFRRTTASPGRVVRAVICAILMLSFAPFSFAQTFAESLATTKYQVLSADVNGDGQNDYLVRPQLTILMISIDDDLTFPIMVPHAGAIFLLQSSPTGNYTLIANPGASIEAFAGWQSGTHDLISGPAPGVPAGAVSIQAKAASIPSFVVAQTPDTGELYLVQQIGGVIIIKNDAQYVRQVVPATMALAVSYPVSVEMKNIGTTKWLAGTTFKLGSQNPADNVSWGLPAPGNRVTVDTAVAAGQSHVFNFAVKPAAAGNYVFQWKMVEENVEWFGEPSPATNVSVVAPHPSVTWSNIMAALSSGSKTQVLSQFADPAAYDPVFTAMQTRLAELPATFTSFDFTEITSRYATAEVTQTFEGVALRHTVTFIYQDGVWLIVDF